MSWEVESTDGMLFRGRLHTFSSGLFGGLKKGLVTCKMGSGLHFRCLGPWKTPNPILLMPGCRNQGLTPTVFWVLPFAMIFNSCLAVFIPFSLIFLLYDFSLFSINRPICGLLSYWSATVSARLWWEAFRESTVPEKSLLLLSSTAPSLTTICY